MYVTQKSDKNWIYWHFSAWFVEKPVKAYVFGLQGHPCNSAKVHVTEKDG